MDILNRILMGLFLLVTPFLAVGYGRLLVADVSALATGNARALSFLGGVVLFFPIWWLASRWFDSVWGFLTTFEHELTHLVVGLAFLKFPVGFRVSAHNGGEVRQIGFGSTGETWVTLAPYFFPTVPLLLILIDYFVTLKPAIFLVALGFVTAFHLISNWSETSFRQPDLKKAGIIKTLLILPVMNVITYGAITAYVTGGLSAFLSFWPAGLRGSWQFFGLVREFTGLG